MSILILFALCAGTIMYAGTNLARYGDAIAEHTGMGKSWMGLVLLATVTSLPELVTGISAVTLNSLPDMAVSGVIGSCMFNMLLIALLDLLSRRKPVSQLVHQGHILSAGFGIVLMGFVAIDILFGKHLPVLTWLNKLDPLSLCYPFIYLLAMRIIYTYEKSRAAEFAGDIAAVPDDKQSTLTKAIVLFVLNAALTVAAACYLPALGEQIAKLTGWGESFIGTSFIAVTTSLPEATVSFTAARRGSFDMAVANLLGSNLFNLAILAIIDYCYVKEPLLRCVSQDNTIAALASMMTMAIVIIGLTSKQERKISFMAADAVSILFVIVLANILLFIAH